MGRMGKIKNATGRNEKTTNEDSKRERGKHKEGKRSKKEKKKRSERKGKGMTVGRTETGSRRERRRRIYLVP